MTIYAEAVTLIEKQFFGEKYFTCCTQHSNLKIKFPNFPTYTIKPWWLLATNKCFDDDNYCQKACEIVQF